MIDYYEAGQGWGITLKGQNVTTKTVKRDLCIGCGVCAGVCPAGNLIMKWGEDGVYIPIESGKCTEFCQVCLGSCPFEDQELNEDELGKVLFGKCEGIFHKEETGYYLSTFAGYSKLGHRAKGASGGLATWFLNELLEQDLVDRIASVTPAGDSEKLFEFRLFVNRNGLMQSAGSCYYPVEFSDILKRILNEEARYAIIGLPCLIKGLRLAMQKQKKLLDRIKYLAGLVCSHTKSSAFAGVLMRALGLDEGQVKKVKFRHKIPGRKSTDYGIEIESANGARKVGLMEDILPRAWPYGLFKPNACNYCDDVFAELADVAFMDAWLPEYIKEPHGTNLVITRNPEANRLFKEGAKRGELFLEDIEIEEVIRSQRSALVLKRDKLAYRLWLAEHEGRPYPKKRVKAIRPAQVEQERIRALEEIRMASHHAMRHQRRKETRGLKRYNNLMKRPIRRFKRLRRWGPIVVAGRILARKLSKGKRLNIQR